MEQELFWTRVHSLLDRRADALRDRRLRAHLLEHPGDLVELLSLREQLAQLHTTQRTSSRRRAAAAAALAGVGLASLAALALLRDSGEGRGAMDRSGIVDFELTVAHENPQERTSTTSDGGEWVRIREELSPDPSGATWLASARFVTRTSGRIEP